MVCKKIINTYAAIASVFPPELEKDLKDNERICPTCHGLGMCVVDNIYGIKGDTSELGKRYMFPYKNQSLSFCPDCCWGVQELCPYCGKPYPKYSTHCNCQGARVKEEQIKKKKKEEILLKAKEVDINSVSNMLYCEENDEYYSCIDDFFDGWDNKRTQPKVLWVTEKRELSIDAGSVIESVCEELHEDASDYCDYKSLQKLLDEWCKEQAGTTTYYPSYKEYVVIDWHKYDKEK